MDERRKGIGRLAVEENVEFDEFGVFKAHDVIVERGVTL